VEHERRRVVAQDLGVLSQEFECQIDEQVVELHRRREVDDGGVELVSLAQERRRQDETRIAVLRIGIDGAFEQADDAIDGTSSLARAPSSSLTAAWA